MKRFKVVSLYFDNKCNLSCPGCYTKNRKLLGRKSHEWFLKLPKYLGKITEQVAIAGYEPFLFPEFVRKFSKACKDYGVICNITTNGTLIPKFSDKQLLIMLRDVTMVSISYDHWKIRCRDDGMKFQANVKRLNDLGVRVGVNLLIDKEILANIERYVEYFFGIGAERVFILHPKPRSLLGLRSIKGGLNRIRKLMVKHRHLYADEYMILVDRYGYNDWKEPCHYGLQSVAIGPDASYSGCSFAKPEGYLKEPKDLLKLINHKFKRRTKCVM